MKFRYIVALCALCLCMMPPPLPPPGSSGQCNRLLQHRRGCHLEREAGSGSGIFRYGTCREYDTAQYGRWSYVHLQRQGRALTDLGRYDEALKTVNAGLIQFSDSSGLWNNKGYVLFKMGQYNDAVDVYIGRKVAAACAARMRKFQLEMGGKNPLIVLDDADLKSRSNAR